MINDTIVAPTTSMMNQAISIIRLSGPDAFPIINKIFSKVVKPHKNEIHYGFIKDGAETLDQVLLMCFENPNSFTGEDVIEINCHGGVYITNKILKLLLKNGARLANRGEFSQRAFLNGKINLIQAEAINDLVHATNDQSAKIAISNLQNKNISVINNFRNDLLDIIANIEVNIDYPEYDGVGNLTVGELHEKLKVLSNRIAEIIALSKIGKVINDGVNLVILGQPNVGKSSLLNALLNEDKAIVSDTPGTTRDIVEGRVNIGNLTLNLIDTAGIRTTDNEIERIGINKAKEQITLADLVLLVFDSTRSLSVEEQELLELTKNKKRIIIINKIDLNPHHQYRFSADHQIEMAAINRDIKSLINKINELFSTDQLFKDDTIILSNIKQISILENVEKSLKNAYNNSTDGFPVDIVNVDLHESWNLLGELLGESYDDNLLDTMFSKYCLGK
ncbi:tRNA uridine-5-carboxymethylaminomethyl(34) synthesis GTPase MnmE [Spiroplasma eriocheiris]|uniref:tRNA modification GTPase MnmE n=1 Tax=Spiroplasma eriocheiris TaxID=315358 RepID=A0A0H3XJL0_9MOLU|nr:tRNA uridine-5-carboxymethylaminomethyl(34) synthesis GTPase MnmE [Spiroplasma eriocheiris]AHF58345.1 putative tRNA modification GTPase [Spiroplasma eriocheiris CCTCC M 207170]AKM54780.1 tRNA modification GTPase TrmE [Spiroplasma eriocheiris]